MLPISPLSILPSRQSMEKQSRKGDAQFYCSPIHWGGRNLKKKYVLVVHLSFGPSPQSIADMDGRTAICQFCFIGFVVLSLILIYMPI
jgi:hypothetical protein